MRGVAARSFAFWHWRCGPAEGREVQGPGAKFSQRAPRAAGKSLRALGPGALRRPWPCAQRTAGHNRRARRQKGCRVGPAGPGVITPSSAAPQALPYCRPLWIDRPGPVDTGRVPRCATASGVGRPPLVELVERWSKTIGVDVVDAQVCVGGPGDRREAVAIAADEGHRQLEPWFYRGRSTVRSASVVLFRFGVA